MNKIAPLLTMLAVLTSPIACYADTAPMSATSSQAAAAAVPANGKSLLVPAGTAVQVHVVGSVNSGSARADDIFEIQAAEDVVVDGMIVVRKGAGGQGHIIEADGASGNGHSGSIALAFDYIYAADGGRVKLSQAAQKQTEEDRKGASSTATIIGFATFGIGGLFGHNFAHGRQKTIDEKTIMSAFVSDNVHVAATEAAIPPHYDH
jgi:hypothetical protein